MSVALSSPSTPTGTVAFESFLATGESFGSICSPTLVAGAASCAFTAPSEGDWILRIVYSGDASNNSVTSADYPYSTRRTAVSMAVTPPAGTYLPGTLITASVVLSHAGPAPTGTVNFDSYTSAGASFGTICSPTLVDGAASCTFAAPPEGDWIIRIVYAGDFTTSPGTSADYPYSTRRTAATFAVTSAPAGAILPGTLITTSVTLAHDPAPTGIVNFESFTGTGSPMGTICSPTLVAGSASCTFAAPPAGDWILRITYAGDSTTLPGNSSDYPYTTSSQAALPTITAIRPSSGSVAGGSAVVIEGTNFDAATTVTFGGVPATVNFYDTPTSLTVTAPPNGAGGAVNVVVTNTSGSATAPSAFTYVSDDNAARDFSVATNPSPRWTYGYELTPGGAFTPYAAHWPDGSVGDRNDVWSASVGSLPNVWHNGGSAPVNRAGTNSTPAGALGMHPGSSDEKTVVRWTAPAAGTYHIAGSFMGLDFSYPTSTDARVLRNNNAAAPLVAQFFVSDYGVAHSFAADVVLNPGETIEFMVGYGGNGFFGDATGLDAVITRTGARSNSAVSLSAASLAFGAELVDVFSPTRTVTLTNTGTDPLGIASIVPSSSFAIQNRTCLSTLAAGASCTVDVAFVPATNTVLSGTLTFNTDAPTSPDVVTLSGTGMLPPSIGIATFTSRTVGQVSTVSVGIQNTISNPLQYSGFHVTLPYPAGFTNDTTQPTQTSCSASVSTDGVSLSASGGIVSPGVTCGVVAHQIFVSSTPGTYTFTIPAGGFTISSPVAYSNPSPITATVTVTATPPPAALSLSTTSLAFGSQAVNTTSASQPVNLTNTGGVAMSISSITVSSGFVKGTSCGTTLNAGASCTVNVSFNPTLVQPYTGTLTILDSASGSPHTVSLSGNGITPAPAVTFTPSSLTFASRTVGTTSTAQTVTVLDNGPGTLTIASVTISGDYAFTSACPSTLTQGATCTIDVRFTPVADGTRLGSLTITSNASGSPHVVTLTGTGQPVAVGVLEVTPSPLTFDPQALNTTSAAQLLVLHNSGTAAVNRGPESVDGDFKLLTGAAADAATSSNTCGASIAPGASCSLALVFTPTALGTRAGAISLPNDTPSSPVITVHLFGTGVTATPPRALTVQPPSLAFGNQAVGTSSAGKTVTITNTLTTAAAITDLGTSTGDFRVSDSCTTIASHASCSPVVTFQPTAVGARAGTLTIRNFAESDPYTVQLTGTGIFNGTPELEVSVTRIGFGNVLLGGASTLGFTLRNIGLVPVTLGAMSVLDDFTLLPTCPTVLDVGQSCAVQVRFLPFTLGVHAASASIFSNAANSPHHVDLTGSGCAIPTLAHARVKPVLCGN